MKPSYTTIVAEIATDIRWLKQSREEDSLWLQKNFDEIKVHLTKINDKVAENSTGVALNKQSIGRLWKIGGGLFTLAISIIAICLHFLGVY